MSNELMRRKRWEREPTWKQRIIGSIGVAAVLMALSPSPSVNTINHSTHAQSSSSQKAESTPEYTEDQAEELRPQLIEIKINQPPPPPLIIGEITRDTGTDSQSCKEFYVCGTDLGIPVKLNDGSTAYLFGDTLAVAGPHLELPPGVDHYRAQAMLISNTIPIAGESIIFDRAIGLDGSGIAPDLFGWGHTVSDGVAIPGTDNIAVSYQDIKGGQPYWKTDQAGIAWSANGGNNFELIGPIWENNEDNTDPYQMWSMQRDGEWVYIVSTRAGRQPGPMMLFRVPVDQMLEKDAYKYWDGEDWGEQNDAQAIMNGHFGEPSMRKLSDGTWVLAYADYNGYPKIVTQTLENSDDGPTGVWSEPKIQLTWHDLPFLYGGFIHPDSTPDNLILMVSSWKREKEPDAPKEDKGELVWYFVGHLVTKLHENPPEQQS